MSYALNLTFWWWLTARYNDIPKRGQTPGGHDRPNHLALGGNCQHAGAITLREDCTVSSSAEVGTSNGLLYAPFLRRAHARALFGRLGRDPVLCHAQGLPRCLRFQRYAIIG